MLSIITLIYILLNGAYLYYAYKKSEKGMEFLEIAGSVIGGRIPKMLQERLVTSSERTKLAECFTIKELEKGIQYYLYKKIGVFYMLIVLGGLIGLIVQQDYEASKEQAYQIERPSYGEGDVSYQLNYQLGEEDEAYSGTTSIVIKEQEADKATAEELIRKALELVETMMIPEGSTADHIVSDMSFNKKPFSKLILLTYTSLTRDTIDDDGEIKWDHLSYEVEYNVEVQVTAAYGEYSDYKVLKFTVFRELPSVNEEAGTITDLVEEDEAVVTLPEETVYGKRKITWSTVEEGIKGSSIFIMVVLVALMMFVLMERELSSKIIKRKEEVLMDFPDIVSKLTILIGAGMTFGRAWDKIVSDYQKTGKKRPLYEEMVQVALDIKMGVPEREAVEKFGERSKSIEVIRLSSILIQNLKHGGNSLTQALNGLREEVWTIRTTNARKQGEKASTKLLLPTFIGLATVLLVVLAPTFMNMKL